MSAGEIGNAVLGPLRQEVQCREDEGTEVCTHRHTHIQWLKSGISFSHTVLEGAWFLPRPRQKQHQHCFPGSLSTPLMLAVSAEKGKAESGGKTGQKIILCFQQVFEASKSCICEVNGRVMAASGHKKPLTSLQQRYRGSTGTGSLVCSRDGTKVRIWGNWDLKSLS